MTELANRVFGLVLPSLALFIVLPILLAKEVGSYLELPGGCICCSLGVVLSATLVKLIRLHKPDRLIIEPTGIGHPAGIIDTQTSETFPRYWIFAP